MALNGLYCADVPLSNYTPWNLDKLREVAASYLNEFAHT